MRCPKGALQHQRAIGGQSAADAVYLGDFQSFFRRYPGQYGRQTPGQHGLAAARRPIEQQIVETRRRYLQCSLGVILALDVCQVHGIGRAPVIVRGSAVRRDGRDSVLSPEVLYQSGEIGDGINFHAFQQSGFRGIHCRHICLGETLIPDDRNHGQDAGGVTKAAVQGQLSQVDRIFVWEIDLAGTDHHADGYRQVISRSFFF